MSRTKHALVVDDEPMIRKAVSRCLTTAGWTVDSAASVAEGRQLLLRESYALVLVDLMLPGASGLELITDAAASAGAPRVLVMSGMIDDDLETEAKRLGARELVQKPFERERLLAAIN